MGDIKNLKRTINCLEKLLAELKELDDEKCSEDWAEGSIFDINNKKDEYCFVYSDGRIISGSFYNVDVDKNRIKFGNAFKDLKYANKRAKEQRLSNILHNFAEVVNDGWVPNWDNREEGKWSVCYDNNIKKWVFSFRTNFNSPLEVYFKTDKLAIEAIEKIIIPFEEEYGQIYE